MIHCIYGGVTGCNFQMKFSIFSMKSFGPRREKTCFRGLRTNKGADQPAHPCSLISAFVIPGLESIKFRHATSKISIF